MPVYTRETIVSVIGKEVGVSGWVTITQDMVNQFAALTGDPVAIHTDVELAKKTPFGGTICQSARKRDPLSASKKDPLLGGFAEGGGWALVVERSGWSCG